MPLVGFVCPDGVSIKIHDCLKWQGCRLKDRCCPMAVLRYIAIVRKYTKVTASMSGNGPRLIYLNEIEDWFVDPDRMMFAFGGTNMHLQLSDQEKRLLDNILAEIKLKVGTSDVLEHDEFHPTDPADWFILYDYKSSGSYAVAKWAGIKVHKEDRPILDADGNKVLLKSGPNKGKVKTKQHREIIEDFSQGDRRAVSLQVNRYRQGWALKGFNVSKMFVFAIPRDGGTYLAKQRGIERRYYKFPLEFIPDEEVDRYYDGLQRECDEAFETGYARRCVNWECWDGERCRNYCEVSVPCIRMCQEHGETWPGGDMKKHLAEKGHMI